MRIAWVGPTPIEGGGAAFVGTQLLRELARAGMAVDCYVAGEAGDVTRSLTEVEGLSFFYSPKRWEWGRWYSRTPMVAFLSGHLARARAQVRIADMIVSRHREQPYDVVYQFSQSEYTPLRRRRHQLPPIVVHPSTHAAGEYRWFRREARLARRAEPAPRRIAVRVMLAARTLVQRYELPRADRVLAVSERFAEHLRNDYRLNPLRLGVVPNPVDLQHFHPIETDESAKKMLALLFVSRISARKGIDLVIALSHRLADLKGQVCIHMFGGPTLWSNYLPLLEGLNSDLARFYGQVTADQLAFLYATADALLQPALYEPFGLTVAEALASGLPVIASDEVGAIAGVNGAVCRTFPAGDLDRLEAAVRAMVNDLQREDRRQLRQIARSEAERLFSPSMIANRLIQELTVVKPSGSIGSGQRPAAEADLAKALA